MPFSSRGTIAAIAILSLGASQFVAAQQLVVEEVLVTARKTEESLNDAPVTVTAFTENAIKTLDINNVSDIARFSPGLSFSSAFGRATERPVIRGQGNILAGVQFGVESGVAYFVDGMYYSGDISSLDLANLSRVEVIKGPQSALYGRNTYSGAINFVTSGTPEEFEGRVRARMLEDDEMEINATIGGQLIDNVLGARLSLRSYQFDGQWNNSVTNKDVGDEETFAANLLLEWTPDERTSVKFRYQNQTDEDGTRPFFLQSATENNCYPGARSLASWPFIASTNNNQYYCGEIEAGPIALNDGPDADGIPNVIPGINEGSTFFGTLYGLDQGIAFSGVERDLEVFSLALEYDLTDDLMFSLLTSRRNEERKTGSDSDHGAINYIVSFLGDESFFANTGKDEYTEQTIELRLDSAGDSAWRWSVGAFIYDYEQDTSDITFAGINDSGTDNFIENHALFGLVGWDVNDQLTLTLEARWAHEEKSQEAFSATGAATFSDSTQFTSFAPRLTVDYALDEDTLIYGIYSEGVKPGGLNGPDGVDVGSAAYDEEESKNFEIGLKRDWLGGRVSSSVAAYFVDITKYQLTTPLADPLGALNSIVTNQGDGEVFGIELDVTAVVTDNVTVGFNYALADSEFTSGCDEFQWSLTSGGGLFTGDEATSLNPTGQGDCSIAGNQFPMGSKHQASGYVDWSYPIGGSGMAFFGNVNVSYESKRYTQVHQEAYTGAATLVGARIGVGGENWSAALVGRNLTDEDSAVLATRWLQVPYIAGFTSLNVAAAGSDTGIPRAFFSLPRRERQLGLEFSYEF